MKGPDLIRITALAMIYEIHYYNVTVKRNELREKVDELEVMERDMIEEAILAFVPRVTRIEIDEMRKGIIGNAFRKAFEEIGGAADTSGGANSGVLISFKHAISEVWSGHQ